MFRYPADSACGRVLGASGIVGTVIILVDLFG
jgi:hypothetical protein